MIDVYHADQGNLSHHAVNTTIHISSVLVEANRERVEIPIFNSMELKQRLLVFFISHLKHKLYLAPYVLSTSPFRWHW